MTTDNYPHQLTTSKPIDTAQYLVCAVLVAVGAFLIYDALSLEAGFAKVDPVGPRMFPIAV
ncbi:MAG: tripartite tricarboxylate transporter TctB family protein, partial [Mycobacterium sp.]